MYEHADHMAFNICLLPSNICCLSWLLERKAKPFIGTDVQDGIRTHLLVNESVGKEVGCGRSYRAAIF